MTVGWPTVALGEIMAERREIPDPGALISGDIRIVSKIGFESGTIELRPGGETKTGMILVRSGDLLVSGINAAKGGIAVYSDPANRPAAATIHYGAYAVDTTRADSRFLWWYLRSDAFKELLAHHLPGGIKTELKSKRLLPVQIRLPPVEKQLRIVERIEAIASRAEKARRLKGEVEEACRAIVPAAINTLGDALTIDGVLSDVLLEPPRNGWSASCDNADSGVAVLALSAVTGFRYRRSEYKRTSAAVLKDAHYWLAPDDLLITRSNTPELVGHAAIYDGTPSPCIYPDLMMKLRINPDYADKKFVWYWLQGRIARDFIKTHAKGTSPTMKKISQGVVSAIPFPKSASLDIQTEAAKQLDLIEARSTTLATTVSAASASLNALLPSVLDKAFRS